MRFSTDIEWVSVDEALPVIPEGLYGVTVLGVTYDPAYGELNPESQGLEIQYLSYLKMKNRNGGIIKNFEGTDLDADFASFWDGPDGYETCPVFDVVLYWAHLPSIPPNINNYK